MKGLFRILIQRLHVFQNETDFFIAFDEQDCELAHKEFVGEWRVECEGDSIIDNPFAALDDRSIIRINFEESDFDPRNLPLFSKVKHEKEGDYYLVSAPAWAWILFNGRGFLCSDEW